MSKNLNAKNSKLIQERIKRYTKVVSILIASFVSRKKPFGQRKKYVCNIKSLLFKKLWMTWEIITYYAK